MNKHKIKILTIILLFLLLFSGLKIINHSKENLEKKESSFYKQKCYTSNIKYLSKECAGEILYNLDKETFEILGNDFSKDKNNVYYRYTLVPGADAKTFKLLNNIYARDKKHIYCNGLKLKDSDSETFTILNKKYNIGNEYAKDKNFVYNICRILKNSDSKSFTILNNYIGKDNNHIYRLDYPNEPIEDIDFKTFKEIKPSINILDQESYTRKAHFKDKNYYYSEDGYKIKPVSQNTYPFNIKLVL